MKKLSGIALIIASVAVGALLTHSINSMAQAQSDVAPTAARSALNAKEGVPCEVSYRINSGSFGMEGIFNSDADQWIVLDKVEESEFITDAKGETQHDAKGNPAFRMIKKQVWIAKNLVNKITFSTR